MSRKIIEDCARALRNAGESERAESLLGVAVVENFDEGGPAFPTIENAVDPRSCGFSGYGGMWLRDYFASQAIAPILKDCMENAAEEGWDEEWRQGVADEAYRIANAMILRRARR